MSSIPVSLKSLKSLTSLPDMGKLHHSQGTRKIRRYERSMDRVWRPGRLKWFGARDRVLPPRDMKKVGTERNSWQEPDDVVG